MTMTASRRVRIGLRPRPFDATMPPPMRKPVAVTASTTPQMRTSNIWSPYGSISAM